MEAVGRPDLFFRDTLGVPGVAEAGKGFDLVRTVVTHLIQPSHPLKGLYKAKDLDDAKLSSTRQRTYFLVRLIAFLESVADVKVGVSPAQVLANDEGACAKLLSHLRAVLGGAGQAPAEKKKIAAGIKAAKNFSKQQRKRAKDALGSLVKFQAICRGRIARNALSRPARGKKAGKKQIRKLKVGAVSRRGAEAASPSPRAQTASPVQRLLNARAASAAAQSSPKSRSLAHISSPNGHLKSPMSSLRRTLAAATAAAQTKSTGSSSTSTNDRSTSSRPLGKVSLRISKPKARNRGHELRSTGPPSQRSVRSTRGASSDRFGGVGRDNHNRIADRLSNGNEEYKSLFNSDWLNKFDFKLDMALDRASRT